MKYRVRTIMTLEHEMTFDENEGFEVGTMEEIALMEARTEGKITSRIQTVQYSEPDADK